MPQAKIWDPIQKKEDEKIREIRGLRKHKPDAPITSDDKIGLACSGGGIRTATLNLGIMEVLREKGILEKVDYLSTVSGGGFVGSWLTASELRNPGWVKRPPSGKNDGLWDESIAYLRSYGNYLSPRLGLLSADSWTMGMIWIRNTLLIQITLAFFLASVILTPRVAGSALEGWAALPAIRLLVPLALFLFACWKIFWNIKDIDSGAAKKAAGQGQVQRLIVVPISLFALLAGSELWGEIGRIGKVHREFSDLWLSLYGTGQWLYAILVAAGIHTVFAFFSLRKPKTLKGVGFAILSAVAGTASLYTLTILVLFLFQGWRDNATSGYWYTFLVGGSAVVDHIPNIDRRFGDGRAEILGIAILDYQGEPIYMLDPQTTITVRISVRANEPVAMPVVGFMLRNHMGLDFAGTNTAREGLDLPAMRPGEIFTIDFHLHLPELYPSSFSFSPAIADGTLLTYSMCDWIDNAIALQMSVTDKPIYGHLHLPCRVELSGHSVLEASTQMEPQLG